MKNVIDVIKLIISSGVFIAAIIGVVKYFYEKNRELYIRRLNEVYAPLFSYLIKQETVRQLYCKHILIKDSPILTMTRTIETVKGTEKILIIDRNFFVEILRDTNKGLIKPRLLKFLSAYEILIFLEESLENGSKEYEIATTKKVEVEYELFKEVQIGYEETVKKLKLDDEFEIDNLEQFII
ncbi:MAG TPA: hypothetical protein VIM70_20120 [Clostridium sp.]|uniref:hypothetical protein n=1 Tax=Clostridium sp. TaxID=1506 RepID=UPI002F95C573